MAKILIVEDEYITAKSVGNSLEKMGHRVIDIAVSADHAIACVKRSRPDIVLMDIKLCGDVDGIEAARVIRERFNIPCVFTTAYADEQTLERAKIAEPYGYILKPFSDQDIQSNIMMALYKHEEERRYSRALEGTIHALGNLVRLHDPYIDEQHEKASALGVAIAEEMGLSCQNIESVRAAGLLHAIGLISMPFDLLNQRSNMSDTELQIFQCYPERSYEVIKDIEFPWPVAEIVRQHQERMDGSGFPAGLSGKAILPEARVVGLACHVAMRFIGYCSDSRSSEKEIVDELRQEKSALFDPQVKEACLRLFEKRGFSFSG